MYILCASDRFNYGDLLFPFLVRSYFQDIIDKFIICSTTESDMSDRGALATEGFHVLQEMKSSRLNILMIAGGECIFCNWKDILGYVKKEDVTEEEKDFPTCYPFTISKEELSNLDIILYNSVGCHQLNEKKELYDNTENRRILESADYISVRDNMTSLGMDRLNIVHHCCPDSAILMSRLFDSAYLNKRTSSVVKDVQKKKYLFFQIGLVHLKMWTKVYAEILLRIAVEKNIHLCLCPIGTALGHDDPVALQMVAQHLPADVYTMIENPSIWDIMSLISNAEIYVGSSLHGAITAMSYNRPLITFGQRKLQVYIETWYDTIGSEYSFVSIENLERRIKQRIDNHFTISAENQMNLAEMSFKRMHKIIHL